MTRAPESFSDHTVDDAIEQIAVEAACAELGLFLAALICLVAGLAWWLV